MTEPPMEKQTSNRLVHGICEVNSIPIDILGRIWTRACRRRAAGRKDVEIIGVTTRSTASFEWLFDTITVSVLHDGIVSIPVISINNDSMGKLYPEIMKLGLEDCVMAVALVVCTSNTPYCISVISSSQGQGKCETSCWW